MTQKDITATVPDATAEANTPTPAPPTKDTTPAPAPAVDDATGTDPQAEDSKPGRNDGAEAAKYRRRLRDVETERDQLNETVETLRQNVDVLHRAAMAQVASARLAKGADLLDIGGCKPSDVLDAAGNIDPAKVDAAIDSVLAERPYLAANRRPLPDPGAGARVPPSRPASWANVVGGRD